MFLFLSVLVSRHCFEAVSRLVLYETDILLFVLKATAFWPVVCEGAFDPLRVKEVT